MRAMQWHGDSLSSLVNVLLFADDRTFERFYFEYGLIPANFASLSIFGIAGRLFWATFMHSGVAHLLTNMCFLAALGPSVERRLGSLGFLAFYLIGGIFGNILQVWSEPTSDAVIMGASGAVASVFAAFLLWFPRARLRSIVFLPLLNLPIPLPGSMPVWLFFAMMEAVQRLWGFFLTTVQRLAATGQFFGPTPQGSISEYAHLGGFIVGLAVPAALYLLARYRDKNAAIAVTYLPVKRVGRVYAYSLSALTAALALFVLAVQSEYSWRVITESKQAQAGHAGASQSGAVQAGTDQNESVADVIAGGLDKEKLKKAFETANQVLPGFIEALKSQPQILAPFKQVCADFRQSGEQFAAGFSVPR
jgi:membrane associated rhomboid family serine protease